MSQPNPKYNAKNTKVLPPSKWRSQRIIALRQSLGLEPAFFALLLGASRNSYEKWEADALTPSAVTCRLLDVIEEDPERFLVRHCISRR